jgi:nucleoside triphosphate pyrophosphatase
MKQPEIILGSRSPRRAEILGYFSLPFRQEASHFDEESIPFNGDPQRYVFQLSKAKADTLAERFPDAIILTADTVVHRQNKIYGKPKDEQDAFRSFSELVGNWHAVYTGVTLRQGAKEFQQVEVTHVLFNPLTPEQIRHYIARIEWSDKAGGYAIQMAGGLIVKKIDGCYYNVMGLPINTVEALLKNVGIELWDYL